MKIVCDISFFYLDKIDPKGSLISEVGQLLQRAKYRIKVLNTINFSKSMHYNPFAYLRSEKDILKLVNTIIVNTKGEGAQSAEDFWVKSERLFYSALIGYIFYEAPEEEKNKNSIRDGQGDVAGFLKPVAGLRCRHTPCPAFCVTQGNAVNQWVKMNH